MKILALDTSSNSCSVAIVENKKNLAVLNLFERETHSKHLLKLIDQVLASAGLDISEIDGFAATKGPGSFTGLRIGLSTIKGLAAATEKPVAGISSLKSLAFGLPVCNEKICAVIDARKGEIYQAFFQFKDKEIVQCTKEVAVTPSELAARLDVKTLFVGTGVENYRELLSDIAGEKAVFPDKIYHSINAVNVAILGTEKIRCNENESIANLVPFYLRKSDAEINLDRQSLKGSC